MVDLGVGQKSEEVNDYLYMSSGNEHESVPLARKTAVRACIWTTE